MSKLRTVVVLLSFCAGPALAQQGYQVIVNSDNQQTEFSNRELSAIFLKKVESWNDGSQIEVVRLTEDSEASRAFDEEIHQRSEDAVKAYWRQQIFDSTATPPLELATSEEVVAYVAEHPNAIAFVPADLKLKGVKQVTVTFEPKLIHRVEPTYTDAAREAGVSGVVILNCVVGTDGKVTDMQVVQSLPHGLTKQAKQAVKQWRFEPATRNGRAVLTELSISLHFKL